jgi:hypothetical protein
VPTAAPWADVACRASPDGRPHRPQSKSGHRSRRSGKPTGSVCRSSPLPSCVVQLAPLSPAQAATTTRGRPQLRPQDWIRSQTPGSPPVRRSQTSAAAHFARSGSAGHRWSAARDTSWLTLITSSGRHIMRRSVRQAPSAASTRPPRRAAGRRAVIQWPRLVGGPVHSPTHDQPGCMSMQRGPRDERPVMPLSELELHEVTHGSLLAAISGPPICGLDLGEDARTWDRAAGS